jgi:hypothetical protein
MAEPLPMYSATSLFLPAKPTVGGWPIPSVSGPPVKARGPICEFVPTRGLGENCHPPAYM